MHCTETVRDKERTGAVNFSTVEFSRIWDASETHIPGFLQVTYAVNILPTSYVQNFHRSVIIEELEGQLRSACEFILLDR